MRWNKDEYTGWGRVLKATGNIARPERMSSLRAAVKESRGPAAGSLRSYGDAALNDGGFAINMSRMDRLIGFDPETGILEAEAGIQIGEIARVFAPKGWQPAVMPGTGFATLGGCIANDVHGKNHHNAGSFGMHVVSVDVLGPKGRTRRLTPDTTADLFAATVGGLGQTGMIVSARIALKPCASEVMEVTERRVEDLTEFLALLDQSSSTHAVGWIDATAKGAHLGRGILEEAETDSGAAPLPVRGAKSVPLDAPQFLLTSPVVRLFNRFYLGRVPVEGRTIARSMQDFYFPLDRVRNWNKLYGKPGFQQFQCVVPDGSARESLSKMMEMIAASGLASPLAVLKRMGDGRAGLMSFPMEGYTLAVDFPNRKKAVNLIAALEDIVLQAGGRIYLAKDALARGDAIAQMYPELPEFARITNEADPKAELQTDMVRRLNLRGAP